MTDRPELAAAVDVWTDRRACSAFVKGRVALFAILRALGIGAGDEVLLPGFTCVVVPAAVCYTGATPSFYDIDPVTLQGAPQQAAARISPRTRAVLVQHNFGAIADLDDLPRLCEERGIPLIEDCAHAMGATKAGQPAGTLGRAAFASLQWSKPTTTGLGGIARANDPQLAAEIARLLEREFAEPNLLKSAYLGILSSLYRNWYRPSWYWTAQGVYRWAGSRDLVQGSSSAGELTSNTMPDNYQERFGRRRERSLRSALSALPAILAHRRETWSWYHEALGQYGVWQPPAPSVDEASAALRYPLLVDNRDALLECARSRKIEIGDWFNAPLHPQGARPEAFGFHRGMAPVAEQAASRIINLPTHPRVSRASARRAINFVLENGKPISPKRWSKITRA